LSHQSGNFIVYYW